MCGIVGLVSAEPRSVDHLRSLIDLMSAALRHRGPDAAGFWNDGCGHCAFGHRRLAVLDLSPEGKQPMVSASGRFVLTFNGEIYSYAALRADLESEGRAPRWRGRSDTEILLAGFEAWGIVATLKRCIGMFALGVFDQHTRTLTLARDRLGEKPLYYGMMGNDLVFASELSAFRRHPVPLPAIDRRALALYLTYNNIPAPHSIYAGLRKLPPGHTLTIPFAAFSGPLPDSVPYWSLWEKIRSRSIAPFAGTPDEACAGLDSRLRATVARQMMADVPLGAFLSGGLDSSLVVALMQAQSARPVKTFTVGFAEELFNEAEYARRVARHLGTEHTEITVTARDALDVIPRLPAIYDEPFGDSSQIPTVLLAELTRRHVTVCLSGDGGDEVFGGYARYFMGERLWRHLRMLPAPVRSGLAGLLEQIRPPSWNRLERLQRRLLWQLSGFPGRAGLTGLTGLTGLASRIPKLVEALRSSTPAAFYERFLEHWPAASNVVLGAAPATESGITPGMAGLAAFWGGVPWAEVPDLGMIPGMMLADTLHYLPDDILVKVDRAAMAASLETRVPFLDHELVEWAWSLPLSLKVRDGQGKWLLRQVLYRYVPRDLVDRPKCGFGVPLADWLRGPLRAWAGDLLAEDRLRREGFFDPRPIRQLWDEHARGVKDHQSRLWLILQFETWLERQREGL